MSGSLFCLLHVRKHIHAISLFLHVATVCQEIQRQINTKQGGEKSLQVKLDNTFFKNFKKSFTDVL